LPGDTDLESQARRFAADVTDLLNNTICDGLRLSAVLTPSGTCLVGRGITKRDFQVRGVPVGMGRRAIRCYLLVAYVLHLDDEGVHLTVAKSNYGLYLDEELDEMLLHYDYDRAPDNEYPVAHLQLGGTSPGFEELGRRAGLAQELKDLHLPVGGKRFRPTLEDLIEFLVVEEFVEARPGWKDVIDEHRAEWEERQLKAAVRRSPDAARAALDELL
jgi:hypothetical protein